MNTLERARSLRDRIYNTMQTTYISAGAIENESRRLRQADYDTPRKRAAAYRRADACRVKANAMVQRANVLYGRFRCLAEFCIRENVRQLDRLVAC